MWETIKWLMSQLRAGGKLDLSDGVWEHLAEEMNNEKPNLSIIDIYTQKMFRGGLVSFEEFELLYNMGDDVFGESRISIMRKFKKAYSKLKFRNGRFEIKLRGRPSISAQISVFIIISIFLIVYAFFHNYYELFFANFYRDRLIIFSLFLVLDIIIFYSILLDSDSEKNAKEIIFRQELYFREKKQKNDVKPLNTGGFGGLFFALGCFFSSDSNRKSLLRSFSQQAASS